MGHRNLNRSVFVPAGSCFLCSCGYNHLVGRHCYRRGYRVPLRVVRSLPSMAGNYRLVVLERGT